MERITKVPECLVLIRKTKDFHLLIEILSVIMLDTAFYLPGYDKKTKKCSETA